MTEHQVRPVGWQSSPESERLPVSLFGHVMPKVYVLIAEVFALPDSADRQKIASNLVAGLEAALSQFPILTGTLEMDTTTGRMWVNKKRDAAVIFYVKYMLDEGEFPSYQELAHRDFPAALIAGHKLLPDSVTAKQLHSPLGDNNEAGIPVAVFQLNFISGGVVLGTAVHHAISDGPGCDGFLTTWAENSAAAAAQKAPLAAPVASRDTPIGPRLAPLDVPDPTAARMAEIRAAYPVLKDAGGPMAPPPPDFKMPTLIPQMWHFPPEKLAELKVLASSRIGEEEEEEGGGGPAWISTYDAIMALLWSRVTTAKLDLVNPLDLNASAILIHAINIRKIWDPPLPERSLCVGAVPARVEPVPIRDIIIARPENLSMLAARVRASIGDITPAYLTGMLEWIAGHADKRFLETNVNSFLGMDFGASSWQGMSSYEKHDFGFGLPSALRWPSPAFEGFVILYPARAGKRDARGGEGVEMCICLEEGCQRRLLGDEMLLRFAQPRG